MKSKINKSALRRSDLIIPIIAILIFVFLTLWFDFVQDDAFITFRYADNYLGGDGLVFNQGERVEGYTNFLWLVAIICGQLLGLSPLIFTKVLGLVFGGLTIIVLHLLSIDILGRNNIFRFAPILLLCSMFSFSYWASSGLETVCFSFCLLGTVGLYIRRSNLFPAIGLLATLVRPEGLMVFFIIVVYDIIDCRRLSKYLIYSIVLYLILLFPFIGFKYFYFGQLLPNPFFAKAGFGFERLTDGLAYLFRYAEHYLAFGLFLLPALMAIRKANKNYRLILSLIIVYGAYIIWIGGDVLKVHRFMVPLMPLMALLITIGITRVLKNKIVAVIGLSVVIGWQVVMPYEFIQTYYNAEKKLVERMSLIAGKLKRSDKTDFKLAASTIGAVSYYLPGHTVIDMLGLTDSTIARHPEESIEEIKTTWKERHFNTTYLLTCQPDYILFSTGSKPSAPAEKALFLHSAFLSNYRTIPFEIFGNRSDIFKRYSSIDHEVKRDINSQFMVLFLNGLDKKIKGDFPEAISDFTEALSYISEEQYSLARYYMAECLRLMKKHPQSYELLLTLAGNDSLTYEVYKDLYTYEYLAYKNEGRAEYYRERLGQLIPWYIATLDGQVRRWERP